MRAVYAKHRCRVFRHVEPTVRKNLFDENTLTLIGTEDEISSVTRIETGDRSVRIDHVRGTADHGTHIDPMIPIEYRGEIILQLFLCGYEESDMTETVIAHAGGEARRLVPEKSDDASSENMSTSVRKSEDGWFLKVVAPEGADIIWQFQAGGKEHEVEADHVVGEAEIRLPSYMGNRLGICITSPEIFGGVEHKHLIFGEVGHPSGRHLWSRGTLYAPKLADQFVYRSLIIDFRPGDDFPKDLRSFDEIELIAEQGDVDAALTAMNDLGVKGIVTSLSHAGRPGPRHGDIVLLTPGDDPIKDETCSYLLFRDQDDPDYPERLEAAVRAARSGADNLIELPWLGAATPTLTSSESQYGIAFSVSGPETRKSKVFTAKRGMLPQRTPCGDCREFRRCSLATAMPWPERLVPGDECTIKNAFTKKNPSGSASKRPLKEYSSKECARTAITEKRRAPDPL
ncbi:hypothetical protein [Roseibium sp. RKSG952]|uniref:hypothetical protein n=1 Tax=Roseibium sp. RKSG952 TaxID=2529384 RepID=UPI0012BBC75B|nr:hypothetical protein [Roseibium sp. RKSG952]MTH97600.1 hypothetical protein [Roseibium sp. RKSG952]